MDVSQLEPAERNPAQLRKTALILLAVMVLGGFAILWAYKAFGQRTSQSDRPSMEFKITDDCRLITADGQERDIQDLKGKVTLALILTTEPDVRSEPTLAAIREVMSAFSDEEVKPTILTFVLDVPEAEPARMATVLSEFGSEPDIWRVATQADGKVSVRAFLKNRLRFGIYPERRDGEFVYDSKLVLLDQHLHLRGLPGSNEGWDFEQVAKMEAQYEQAKQQEPNANLIPPPMTTPKLRELLLKSIKYLYAHPDEKGQAK